MTTKTGNLDQIKGPWLPFYDLSNASVSILDFDPIPPSFELGWDLTKSHENRAICSLYIHGDLDLLTPKIIKVIYSTKVTILKLLQDCRSNETEVIKLKELSKSMSPCDLWTDALKWGSSPHPIKSFGSTFTQVIGYKQFSN